MFRDSAVDSIKTESVCATRQCYNLRLESNSILGPFQFNDSAGVDIFTARSESKAIMNKCSPILELPQEPFSQRILPVSKVGPSLNVSFPKHFRLMSLL